MYYYDQYGWLTSQPIEGRSTDKAPPTETQTLKANWTGLDWVLVTYTAPPVVTPPVVVDPTQWLIDVGPFFDRTGAAKMAILTSTDPTVKAIIADLQVRKWVDLKRTDVAQGLAYIGSVVPALTGAIQTAILTTPVSAADNLALRKLYFS